MPCWARSACDVDVVYHIIYRSACVDVLDCAFNRISYIIDHIISYIAVPALMSLIALSIARAPDSRVSCTAPTNLSIRKTVGPCRLQNSLFLMSAERYMWRGGGTKRRHLFLGERFDNKKKPKNLVYVRPKTISSIFPLNLSRSDGEGAD